LIKIAQDPLYQKINRAIGQSIVDFGMIESGDKILVAISGGKDSLCMLYFLQEFQRKAKITFDILAVNVDQKQPDFPIHVLPDLFKRWGVAYQIVEQDTFSVVKSKTLPGKSYCSLCSRLRRGILYDAARRFGCNKIALGHHRDDVLETFLMNLFFYGQLSAMPANYLIQAEDLHVIRPLFSVHEDWIEDFVQAQKWAIIPCNLCGSQENMKRQEMKALLEQLQEQHPRLRETAFGALQNIEPRFLFDKKLWKHDVPKA
jgi:tRNA 2-thiocytidine biosynthesis protein TtcA